MIKQANQQTRQTQTDKQAGPQMDRHIEKPDIGMTEKLNESLTASHL